MWRRDTPMPMTDEGDLQCHAHFWDQWGGFQCHAHARDRRDSLLYHANDVQAPTWLDSALCSDEDIVTHPPYSLNLTKFPSFLCGLCHGGECLPVAQTSLCTMVPCSFGSCALESVLTLVHTGIRLCFWTTCSRHPSTHRPLHQVTWFCNQTSDHAQWLHCSFKT